MAAEVDLGDSEVTITLAELVEASRAVQLAEEERDRARFLAAKLEEVVAMHRTVLEALVAWGRAGYDGRRPGDLMAICEWAEAQLSEVP